jgi:hypothetical protein
MGWAPKIAVTAVLALAFAATGAGASTPFVTTKVPTNQTVKSLLKGKFHQTVMCRDGCRVIARIFIKPQLARTLGFKGVKSGQNYAVGLKQVNLGGEKPTRVLVPLGADANKRLAKWKKSLQLMGETYASSTSSHDRGQANWITTLRR